MESGKKDFSKLEKIRVLKSKKLVLKKPPTSAGEPGRKSTPIGGRGRGEVRAQLSKIKGRN